MFEKYTVTGRDENLGTKDFDPDDINGLDKEETKEKYKKLQQKFADLQEVLYASKQYGLLVLLQGIDCSGKDGKVLSGVNPNGFYVENFKEPTPVEPGHDYLWRVHQKAPQKSDIFVFNRSYYEDVLVTRVHGTVDDETARRRFGEIRDFEKYLVTTIPCCSSFFFISRRIFSKKSWRNGLRTPKRTGNFPRPT